MSRLSISNLLLPVSLKQFKTLTAQFGEVAERAFGGPCKLEIRAMNATKLTSTFLHDDWVMKAMAEDNKQRTFFETDDVAKLNIDVWNRAAYIEVSVSPLSKEDAPAHAWGHAEFKGRLPRQATFYLQPVSDNALKPLSTQNPFMRTGDGFSSNCRP